MKNNNIGCFGWAFLIFIALWMLGLFIEFWYIFVSIAILAVIIVWWKNKSTEQKPAKQKSNESIPTEVKPKLHTIDPYRNAYIPHPNYDEIFEYVRMEPPIMRLENHKYLNSWTNNYTASPKSLLATQNKIHPNKDWTPVYKELLRLSKINSDEAIREYLEVLMVNYYEGGLLAYKRGDFDKAEQWFLQVLDVNPLLVSKRLAVLFNKEKRYSDVVYVYSRAIEFTNNWFIMISESNKSKLLEEYRKAQEKLAKLADKDCSKGITIPNSIIDHRFLNELNRSWMQNNKPAN